MTRLALLGLITAAACGGSGSSTPPDANDPANVPFGTTAIVVVVNPTINDANSQTIAQPGTTRAGVTLTTDDGVTATTDATGIAVLAPVTAGMRTITVTGTGVTGTIPVSIANGSLRELAIATDATQAQTMVEVDYKTDQAVMLDPSMSNAQVNDALKVSDRIVFFAGGQYVGDLDFGGSRVTLFGEGALGGRVVVQGNVTVSGSNGRIRGTHITGNLTIPASGVGLSFSRVDGAITSEGSDGVLLANALCGAETVTGSGTIAVGNAGAAPLTTCP
ncbi:MAG: hypothetical protein H6Q90_1306 [Deltaproteobacteria bacterium]|nr:hypothetical protein [Deltaproteobacteria bacterium]